ncbi:unnamed protein product [Symbiodinium natans]|uniref:Sulfotransferase domain-containing protein n=1 Tax=Symbiodinium natans TaxID=878477 RepID=A0A812G2N8_9DINO|nr:unnamed protein product [Symbiodinium natans]
MQTAARWPLFWLLPYSVWSYSGVTAESNALNFVQRKVLPRVSPPPELPAAESAPSKPWHVHKYICVAHHKAGLFLVRDLCKAVFDTLGATPSEMGEWIQPCYPRTCVHPKAPIQFWMDLYSYERAQEAREAAGAKGMRVVGIVRDPVSVIVSAYCYHHRGEEPGNVVFENTTLMHMGPKQGLKFVAERMLQLVENMTSAFEQPFNDTFHLVYEKVTQSSEAFDQQVGEMTSFLFQPDLISPAQRSQVLNATQSADLHRHPGANGDHGNDKACEDEVRKYVPSLPPELLSRYRSFQERLGYAASEEGLSQQSSFGEVLTASEGNQAATMA